MFQTVCRLWMPNSMCAHMSHAQNWGCSEGLHAVEVSTERNICGSLCIYLELIIGHCIFRNLLPSPHFKDFHIPLHHLMWGCESQAKKMNSGCRCGLVGKVLVRHAWDPGFHPRYCISHGWKGVGESECLQSLHLGDEGRRIRSSR